jgi:N-methylhydantoinase A
MIAGRFQIGCDVGGTFTDVAIVAEDGRYFSDKSDTTPDDLSRGMLSALQRAADQVGCPLEELLAATTRFVNGTTVVTNAIATLSGARVGLITTRGHGDMLRIARSARNAHRDHHRQVNLPQIVPRERVVEVDERIDKKGAVAVVLSEDDARRAIDELVAAEVDSIAISLLWSFANPAHEELLASIIEAEHPDVYLSVGSRLHPVMREYERTMTTVLNSFTGKKVAEYTRTIETELAQRGLRVPISFMQGFGGTLSAQEARVKPIALIDSGPAGGVVGASRLGSEIGIRDVIAADMGGTSFDVTVLPDGAVTVSQRVMLGERFLTGLAKIDVHPVGAGGGSLGWIDVRGVPRVGPQSAGAFPGPAAYGQGGTEPTVTDAAITLGIIDPKMFLGGRRSLDADQARSALIMRLGDPLGLDAETAAGAMYRLVCAEMGNAVRAVTVERGHDPRRFALVAFGGALGIFGADIARSLDIPKVVIPAQAAVFSAYGLLATDDVRVAVRSVVWAGGDAGYVDDAYRSLEREALQGLIESGYGDEQISVEWQGDFKFAGQLWELTLPVPRDATITEATLEAIRARFPEHYEREYGEGTAWEGTPVMLLAARVVARGTADKFRVSDAEVAVDTAAEAVGRRSVVRAIEGVTVEADVYDTRTLRPGEHVIGPAIVNDPLTTIQVPPDWALTLDAQRNFILDDRRPDGPRRRSTMQEVAA